MVAGRLAASQKRSAWFATNVGGGESSFWRGAI
jgi:hypothetical protein